MGPKVQDIPDELSGAATELFLVVGVILLGVVISNVYRDLDEGEEQESLFEGATRVMVILLGGAGVVLILPAVLKILTGIVMAPIPIRSGPGSVSNWSSYSDRTGLKPHSKPAFGFLAGALEDKYHYRENGANMQGKAYVMMRGKKHFKFLKDQYDDDKKTPKSSLYLEHEDAQRAARAEEDSKWFNHQEKLKQQFQERHAQHQHAQAPVNWNGTRGASTGGGSVQYHHHPAAEWKLPAVNPFFALLVVSFGALALSLEAVRYTFYIDKDGLYPVVPSDNTKNLTRGVQGVGVTLIGLLAVMTSYRFLASSGFRHGEAVMKTVSLFFGGVVAGTTFLTTEYTISDFDRSRKLGASE